MINFSARSKSILARWRLKALALTAAVLAVSVLSGCVTSTKYYMAPDDTPPAVPLNFTAGIPALDLTLKTVIVYQGPGSWKQEAHWDEYVVALTNRGSVPLTIESAMLLDPLGENQVPGTNPWTLERLSETNFERYGRVGLYVLGAGVAGQSFLVGLYGIGLGGSFGLLVAAPLVLAANVTVVGIKNRRNKRNIQTEFDRRQLRLPHDLAAGATRQGSLFFPAVPQPQRLVLRGKAGEAPLELVLDLKALAGLHVQQPVAK